MGEIRARVTLENSDDRAVVYRGHGVEADVRRTTVEGIVDTGAVSLIIPEEIANLATQTEAIVGPAGSQVLIGQVVLEVLDLIADCRNQTLAPRHPEGPVLPLRRIRCASAP